LNSGNLLFEPGPEETRSQSGLKKQLFTGFPFIFGRRADIAGGVDGVSKIRLLIGDRMPFSIFPFAWCD
jgi:hypothetical protein